MGPFRPLRGCTSTHWPPGCALPLCNSKQNNIDWLWKQNFHPGQTHVSLIWLFMDQTKFSLITNSLVFHMSFLNGNSVTPPQLRKQSTLQPQPWQPFWSLPLQPWCCLPSSGETTPCRLISFRGRLPLLPSNSIQHHCPPVSMATDATPFSSPASHWSKVCVAESSMTLTPIAATHTHSETHTLNLNYACMLLEDMKLQNFSVLTKKKKLEETMQCIIKGPALQPTLIAIIFLLQQEGPIGSEISLFSK